MPITSKVELFETTVRAMLDQSLSPEAQRAFAVAESRRALGTAQQHNRMRLGRVPDHITTVDGRQGASEEMVRIPGGRILYEFVLLEEAIDDMFAMLVRAAPVGRSGDKRPGHPGLYRNSVVLIANNQVVSYTPGGRTQLPDADMYILSNTVPYARKIERGLSNQAPEGVFEAVAAMSRRRFSNYAKIKFGYASLNVGGIDAWARQTGMPSRYRRGAQREAWLRAQPAIYIYPYA